MSAYTGLIKSQVQGKHGSRGAIWFVRVTSPDWTAGVDGIGASTWLLPSDDQANVETKRDTLVTTLLQHAEANSLSTDGLEVYLTELVAGVGA